MEGQELAIFITLTMDKGMELRIYKGQIKAIPRNG
jgi:hypothetical protein